MKYKLFVVLAALLSVASPDRVIAQTQADWTFMVFMNGSNSLEGFAIRNFGQLASIGSTKRVNLVVELGRMGSDSRYGGWSGVYRFHVTKGMTPTKQNADPSSKSADPTFDPTEVDMGSADSVKHFVKWVRSNYPAQHYALVVWDHGQGYRALMQLAASEEQTPQRDAAVAILKTNVSPDIATKIATRAMPQTGSNAQAYPVKSVSYDERTGNVIRNAALDRALRDSLGGRQLDILGFDACLMAMVEVDYAFRDVASTVVSSEENEPGDGWDYSYLAHITANPDLGSVELARLTVQMYRNTYYHSNVKDTTFSAYELSNVAAVAQSISDLANLMIKELPNQYSSIRKSRIALATYGANQRGFTYVDLARFCALLAANTTDPGLRSQALATKKIAQQYVLANYASSDSVSRFGSTGLSIYFPASRADYELDPAYHPGNTEPDPVQFVLQYNWASFLKAYNKA